MEPEIQTLVRDGQYREAASLLETRADRGGPGVIDLYTRAEEYFTRSGSEVRALNCRYERTKLLALRAVEVGDIRTLNQCATILTGISIDYSDRKLLKYVAKNVFFEASLCSLAARNRDGVIESLSYIQTVNPLFADSTEHMNLRRFVDCRTAKAFRSTFIDINSVIKFDPWKTAMLDFIATTLPE